MASLREFAALSDCTADVDGALETDSIRDSEADDCSSTLSSCEPASD
ncbi:MAG: hypothetical protein ACOX1H_02985 [Pseudoramibacter sp.]